MYVYIYSIYAQYIFACMLAAGPAKEPYVSVKRALLLWQKGPISMAKEPYFYDKRALFLFQKRPICCMPAAERGTCGSAILP